MRRNHPFVFERTLSVLNGLLSSQVNLDRNALHISKSLPLTSPSRPSWWFLLSSQVGPDACQDKCTHNMCWLPNTRHPQHPHPICRVVVHLNHPATTRSTLCPMDTSASVISLHPFCLGQYLWGNSFSLETLQPYVHKGVHLKPLESVILLVLSPNKFLDNSLLKLLVQLKWKEWTLSQNHRNSTRHLLSPFPRNSSFSLQS